MIRTTEGKREASKERAVCETRKYQEECKQTKEQGLQRKTGRQSKKIEESKRENHYGNNQQRVKFIS